MYAECFDKVLCHVNSRILKCKMTNVITRFWDKCEDETHTPKSGKLEFVETPENSELEFKGQNTFH